MYHSKVEPSEIHSAWCSCNDCRYDADRRSATADLVAILVCVAVASVFLAALVLGGR